MRTWKPDTCECIIEEIYNGSEIVGGGEVIKKCQAHSTVQDSELYGVLYANPDGENKVKNQIHNILLGHDSIKNLGLHIIKKDTLGNDFVDFVDGVEYKWRFQGQGKKRKIEVEVIGKTLTQDQKDSIDSLVTSKFGVGKMKLK